MISDKGRKAIAVVACFRNEGFEICVALALSYPNFHYDDQCRMTNGLEAKEVSFSGHY